MVYTDWMMFLLACFRVLLKAPRLTPVLNSLSLAFSSYLRDFSARFSAKASIRNVSSCVLVKRLFFVSIFTIGSFRERISHFWTLFFKRNLFTRKSSLKNTILYTGRKVLWFSFL